MIAVVRSRPRILLSSGGYSSFSHSFYLLPHLPRTETCTTKEPSREAPSCSSRHRHRASGPGGQPVTRGYGAPRLVPVRKQLRYLCAGVTPSFFSRVLVRTAQRQSSPVCSAKGIASRVSFLLADILFDSTAISMDASLVFLYDKDIPKLYTEVELQLLKENIIVY